MFEKLKEYFDKGKSMLEQALLEPEDDFVTVPEGVTCEQLIEEAKEYVDAIIVHKHDEVSQDEAADKDGKETGGAEGSKTPDDDKDEQEA